MGQEHPRSSPRLVKPERFDAAPRFLFLNSYDDLACTKCPKCDAKTKVRKVPLVIHIEPGSLLVLNKNCRLCEACSLLIVRQREIEPLMVEAFEQRDPSIIGNDYLIIGTLPRAAWRNQQRQPAQAGEAVKQTRIFENQWDFERTGGWMLDPT